MILVLISIYLIKIIINNYETFQSETNLDNFNQETKNLRKIDQLRLNTVKDDSNLFSQFCKKIKYFDDNYNDTSRLKIFNKYSQLDDIDKNKKKINKYLNEIFSLQEKIYFNKNDIAYFKQNEENMNKKTRIYLDVLDKVIENLKNNLNSNVILNIK